MENQQIESIEEMLAKHKSEDILKESFSIFSINSENILSRVIILLLSLILAFTIGFLNTVEIMEEVTTVILDTHLALFGIIFTGYSFFQALLNGQLVTVLIEDVSQDSKNKKYRNTLHNTNRNFIQLMMQFLIAIFMTLTLKIVLSCMPKDFCLFDKIQLNIVVASLLIFAYFYHLAVVMWRMVSFVFNIYQLFNSYAVTKYLSFVKHNDDE